MIFAFAFLKCLVLYNSLVSNVNFSVIELYFPTKPEISKIECFGNENELHSHIFNSFPLSFTGNATMVSGPFRIKLKAIMSLLVLLNSVCPYGFLLEDQLFDSLEGAFVWKGP